ncbi:uncharacterized protein JCM15063_003146 [Sporobolomyces koalae]|uniref:uncharacterized protein n=1 Tax=Sporobolomyces koalae TaxID=500713 RepID=UPI00316EE5AD
MFTTFSQGSDDPSNWNDQPSYLPGRFHAHVQSPTLRSTHVSQNPSNSESGAAVASPSQTSPTRKFFFKRSKQSKPDSTSVQDRRRTHERDRLLLDSSTRSPYPHHDGKRLTISPPPPTRRTRRLTSTREQQEEEEEDEHSNEINWWLLRPGKKRVRLWMSSWYKRWALLVGIPCLIVWVWCSIPFPVQDPYKEEPPWHIPWSPPTVVAPRDTFTTLPHKLPWIHPSSNTNTNTLVTEQFSNPTSMPTTSSPSYQAEDPELPVDANFYFFLIIYYGSYVAVALVFVTKLFDLYRLNWWPTSLGGPFWYTLFWTTSLFVGFLLHKFDLDGFGRRSHSRTGGGPQELWDWERKTTWILLAFATMAMPALACFMKLRADRRNSWRRSLTPAQKTFLERQLTQRMPRSYRRFLWFLTAIALSLLTLIMGQGFATIYLSTLPHSNFEGLVYVWTLILSINLLNNVSNWILHRKVRSQSLVFIFRLLFQLTYHVFYRNLFARLRSPDQAAYITLLSSSFVILWYPLSMSKTFHRLLIWTVGTSMEWPEYSQSVATMFYLRNLSENVTMVAFLGWVTILHWGPNKMIYPFFSFADDSDPYTYRLTISASLVIWLAELLSSWMARWVCWWAYAIDVTNVGLDQLREHPDLVVTCIAASTHVLMDILLFLVKLNFR